VDAARGRAVDGEADQREKNAAIAGRRQRAGSRRSLDADAARREVVMKESRSRKLGGGTVVAWCRASVTAMAPVGEADLLHLPRSTC
jgi:hypothetical protein